MIRRFWNTAASGLSPAGRRCAELTRAHVFLSADAGPDLDPVGVCADPSGRSRPECWIGMMANLPDTEQSCCRRTAAIDGWKVDSRSP